MKGCQKIIIEYIFPPWDVSSRRQTFDDQVTRHMATLAALDSLLLLLLLRVKRKFLFLSQKPSRIRRTLCPQPLRIEIHLVQ